MFTESSSAFTSDGALLSTSESAVKIHRVLGVTYETACSAQRASNSLRRPSLDDPDGGGDEMYCGVAFLTQIQGGGGEERPDVDRVRRVLEQRGY